MNNERKIVPNRTKEMGTTGLIYRGERILYKLV